MTPPYRFLSFTALLLTPGTRKRPPQSGSVQTGFAEPWAGSAFDGSKLRITGLLARVDGSLSGQINFRSAVTANILLPFVVRDRPALAYGHVDNQLMRDTVYM